MSLNIKGTDVRLYGKCFPRQDGTKSPTQWQVPISKKDAEGHWQSIYVKVVFSKKIAIPEGIPSGSKIDFDGFMSLEKYTGRDGVEHTNPTIVIMSCDFKEYNAMVNARAERDGTVQVEETFDNFAQVEEDLPF